MNFKHEVEEYVRLMKEDDVNWVEAYYIFITKDFMREFADKLKPWSEIINTYIWHTFGEDFFIELFGKEAFIKMRNRIEFRNDT